MHSCVCLSMPPLSLRPSLHQIFIRQSVRLSFPPSLPLLFIPLSIRSSMSPSVPPSVNPSVLFSVPSSVCPSLHRWRGSFRWWGSFRWRYRPSVRSFVRFSVHLQVGLTLCPSVPLSVYLSVRLLFCPSVPLPVRPSIHSSTNETLTNIFRLSLITHTVDFFWATIPLFSHCTRFA